MCLREREREAERNAVVLLLPNKSDKGSGQTTQRVANGSTIISPPFQFISPSQWFWNWATRTTSANVRKCPGFNKLDHNLFFGLKVNTFNMHAIKQMLQMDCIGTQIIKIEEPLL